MPISNVKGTGWTWYHADQVNIRDAEIGDGSKVGSFVVIGPNVVIGKNCSIQDFCFIPEGVIIEDGVFVGPGVRFLNDKYPPSHGAWRLQEPTRVGRNAVIGGGAIIMPGIKIGHDAKIGAGALVMKEVYPFEVVVCKVDTMKIVSGWGGRR
uniref:Putative acetyltransferase n=1 Tax=viral metagenome TaxID=1070528 RepID=A0A6M3L996_9ZZZZ